MNIFALEKFDDEGRRCTFYTVRWAEGEQSETEKFFEKYFADERFKSATQELADFISRKIGDEVGAMKCFFKFEDQAEALPPSGNHKVGEVTFNFNGFPLRLYCLRICKSLVVLFNGGEKTSQTALGGKTSMAFTEANQFAKLILEALYREDIYITPDEREFRDYNGKKEIFI